MTNLTQTATATQNLTAMTAPNRMRVYACGGAAAAIAPMIEHSRDRIEIGLAPLDATYVDTSLSDLPADLSSDYIYIVEGTKDGSGGVRGTNSDPIRKRMLDLLEKHAPTNTVVVLSSASGGTGNVIAGSLINELLAREVNVIVIAIGSTESDIRIKNTKATLGMYEKLAKLHKRPLNLMYFENTVATPPSVVDEQVCRALVAVSVVFSRQNKGLDTSDLSNFLNYNGQVTAWAPHMSGLSVVEGQLNDDDASNKIISVASVINSLDERGVNFRPPYSVQGILPSNAPVPIKDRIPMHLVIRAYPFNDIAANLDGEIAAIARAAAASQKETSTVLSADDTSDDFLML